MKLDTSIRWKGVQGHRSEIKVTQRRLCHYCELDSLNRWSYGSEQKLTQILTTVGRWIVYVFKVMGSKVKDTETFAVEAYNSTICYRRPSCLKIVSLWMRACYSVNYRDHVVMLTRW